MSEGCLNEGVYLFFNHPEFPTGVESMYRSSFFFFFFETNWRNFFFAKENSLWPFDSWKMITEIFQQPAKKKIINMHDTEME